MKSAHSKLSTSFDVLVIGAGPAGAHTALRLAQSGWQVGLLDSRAFPREKPCGEFLSPACLPMLEELGLLDDLMQAKAAQVNSMEITSPSHRTLGKYRPLGRFTSSHGFGLGIRREVLDTVTTKHAASHPNITLLLEWRMTEILFDHAGHSRGVQALNPFGKKVQLNSRFLVGADGQRSRVSRALNWNLPLRNTQRFALVARYANVQQRATAGLHVIGSDYFAACPIDDGAFTVNLVVDRGQMPKGRAKLREYFEARLRETPQLEESLRHARSIDAVTACGPLGVRVKRCASATAALVGDACGFVDPMTGEGLFFAMRGAALLAPCIDRALRKPARAGAALRRYARRRRLQFGPRYALARLLQRGLRRPDLADRVVGWISRSPSRSNLLLGLTGDYLPPFAIFSPDVWRSAHHSQDRDPAKT